MGSPDPDGLAWDDRGLIPAVVQDAASRRVLMLGWMNREALERTRTTGRVHFWSRSRQEMWEKGATSGNWLEFESLTADCDHDALLVQARAHGPTCHTGTATCWGDADAADDFAVLADLWEVIVSRARTRPAGSYTSRLLEAGPEGPGRKVVEEATEVLLAAKDHATGAADERRVAEEAADLVYHLMVLLAERGIDISLVWEVLAERRR
jgi:phosphoribosyl-AMP cyclohydrolase / phosphoribosyl-ATP pyrophosphohydrolase